jgi:2-C-methyl-D-erythritol 4-phosphate cytidylyltransferase
MRSEVPKQYLAIEGRSVLEYSLLNLWEVPTLSGIVVCIHAQDSHWRKLGLRHSKLLGTVTGGETRAESVINGISFLRQRGDPEDWVVVHDAVRPCVWPERIQGLIENVHSDDGGLLAVPVTDTVKKVNPDHRVDRSVDRESLWLAQTPQFFKLGLLEQALGRAVSDHAPVTDEASAITRR